MFKIFQKKFPKIPPILPKIFELFEGLVAINEVRFPKNISFSNFIKNYRSVSHHSSTTFYKNLKIAKSI